MSELEKREDISRYDSIATEELQEILRKHTHGELKSEPDTQDLFEIMELLSKRRQNENPQAFRSNVEAFAEFREHYMPKEKSVSIQPKKFQIPARLLKTAAAVLVAVLLLTAGTVVTAKAFHFDIWGKFASWTEEFFHFTDASDSDVTEPKKEFSVEYNQLRDVLKDHKVDEEIAPSWLPDGYKHKDIMVMNSPKERIIMAIYECNNVELVIYIRQTFDVTPEQIEKNDSLVELYTANGTDYYIFSNNEKLQTVWIAGELE